MNDGQQPPIPPKANSEQQPAAPIEAGQTPPTQIPVTSLAPPPGNGAKPWIIIGIIAVLIGGGIWMLTSSKENTGNEANVEQEDEKPKIKPRPKPRKAVKTDDRPLKKEMAELSSKNRADFEKNVGKWVRLQGEVESGDADGVLIFKEPAKMTGQLVKGSAEHLTGQIVKVNAWMISEEKIQIDGIFDVTTIDPVELLPKKDVYTTADAKQLISLRNSKVTFEGKVKKIRLSKDEKSRCIVFEGDSHEFLGVATLKQLKKVGVTEKTLEDLVGKTIKLKGKLGYLKVEDKEQIIITYKDKDDFEVVE